MYMFVPSVQVTQRYLEYLVSQRRFDEAANACARLLKVRRASCFSFKSFRLPSTQQELPLLEFSLGGVAVHLGRKGLLGDPDFAGQWTAGGWP